MLIHCLKLKLCRRATADSPDCLPEFPLSDIVVGSVWRGWFDHKSRFSATLSELHQIELLAFRTQQGLLEKELSQRGPSQVGTTIPTYSMVLVYLPAFAYKLTQM